MFIFTDGLILKITHDERKIYGNEQTDWERLIKYGPETLAELEKKFAKVKEQGLMEGFAGFEEFFEYFREIGLKAYYLTKGLFVDNYNGNLTVDQGRAAAEKLKTDPAVWDFFTNQQQWKTGRLIDTEQVGQFIKVAADKVAEENY